jgi:hypothetical protein
VNRWGPTPVAEATIRKGLKLRSPVTALKLTRGPSGRVASVQVVTASGRRRSRGATLRSRAGCARRGSPQLVTLSLTRPAARPVRQDGCASRARRQGVKGAVLQPARRRSLDEIAGPALQAKVKLLAPASFRIAAGKVPAGAEGSGAPLVRPERPPGPSPARSSRSPAGTPVSSSRYRTAAGRRSAATADGRGAYAAVVPEPGVVPRPDRAGAGLRRGPFGQLELR